MKSETWLIVELGVVMFAIGVLSFFWNPVYEKGVAFVSITLAGAMTTIIGYKFGRSMPQQVGDPRPGQTSKVDTEVKSTTKTDALEVEVQK